jgi:hypothetical protein
MLGGERKEPLGQAVGQVEEGEVREVLIGPAQAHAQGLQQRERCLGAFREPLYKGVACDDERFRLFGGDAGGGARAAIEDGELAEAVAGTDVGDGRLLAQGGKDGNADAAFDDDVKGITGLALVKEGRAGTVVAHTAALGERADILTGETRQQRHIANQLLMVLGGNRVLGHTPSLARSHYRFCGLLHRRPALEGK